MLSAAGLLSAPTAQAQCCAGAFKAIEAMEERLTQLFREVGVVIQAELQRQTLAIRHIQESIATYEVQEDLRREVRAVEERYTPPENTCATLSTSEALRSAETIQRERALRTTQERTQAFLAEASPQARLHARHTRSVTQFCSDLDARAGRCSQTGPATRSGDAPPRIPNGDITAAYLFGHKDGLGLTYAPGQTAAVEAYIDRFMGLPPAALPRTCDTPACAAFEELRKDYIATAGLPLHSLSEIMSHYVPQKGLAENAGVVRPGDSPEGISMMEVLSRRVQQRLDKDHLTAQAVAPRAETLLRDIVQNQAFALWMDFNALRQEERIESLKAASLAMVTQHRVKPMAEAQRANALQSSHR
jgi:hypothetical protein